MLLDGIMHEQAFFCQKLYTGHVVGSGPMKREEKCIACLVIVYRDLGRVRAILFMQAANQNIST